MKIKNKNSEGNTIKSKEDSTSSANNDLKFYQVLSDKTLAFFKKPFNVVVFVGSILSLIIIIIFASVSLGQKQKNVSIKDAIVNSKTPANDDSPVDPLDPINAVVYNPTNPSEYTDFSAKHPSASLFGQYLWNITDPSSDPSSNASSAVLFDTTSFLFPGDIGSLQPQIQGRITFFAKYNGLTYLFSSCITGTAGSKQTGVNKADLSGFDVNANFGVATENFYLPTSAVPNSKSRPEKITSNTINIAQDALVPPLNIVDNQSYVYNSDGKNNLNGSFIQLTPNTEDYLRLLNFRIFYIPATVITGYDSENPGKSKTSTFNYMCIYPIFSDKNKIVTPDSIAVLADNSYNDLNLPKYFGSNAFNNVRKYYNPLGFGENEFTTLDINYFGKSIKN